MGTLDIHTSAGPLETEHQRLLDRLLRRGENRPELQPKESFAGSTDAPHVRRVRQSWRRRMVHEHESAAVFSQIMPQLMAAEAPLDFKTVVLRCSMDELRHAGLCGQVVEYLGGEARAEADLEMESIPAHDDVSPRQAALRNVVFASCLSETVSMALLTAEHERASDPFVRRVLRQLSGDESLHARFGWAYLAFETERDDGASTDALSSYLPTAFGYLESKMMSEMPPGRIDDDELEKAFEIGFSASDHARDLFLSTMSDVIVPRLEDFGLDARAAWNDRLQIGG
ncbi:MAG: ferritin-like domain-containing protein [Myxococcota bacterium]